VGGAHKGMSMQKCDCSCRTVGPHQCSMAGVMLSAGFDCCTEKGNNKDYHVGT
jgi:hypothetical protein